MAKKPGFLQGLLVQPEYFGKKPGFWRDINTKETGFFAEFVGATEVFWKKPGFCLDANR
ncbi:MAG: hypothetical protein JGK17_12270 [Microcoleus sp. PH2017_10_PVI_O_A]|uniref:hypothetical protein n=1 Tax=unclassified Microcoleus TaxID=2642155 RepID=UPI001DC19613|nr:MULTISPECIES: hypothetical protein [unclassified Microcoleus]MCC3406340.1 hypothetical protein [Microcoleus sp. PH2017_10_PVI_O_A]MCC3460324.1 hypothetical protein [Microcoleus sp. PH2017_11_PCY_U_A]MCC3478857.1 hypothetical protein [Microcoleus sp. PH2017_12_PCY_D_A]MCC3528469.1 hypothetical protein [Microcoleus sp. PH2017_21_RUC_O_A]MCC3540645.1 hypothetical protein [Microcoleus sp. PH2017_22_RUC_O_B]